MVDSGLVDRTNAVGVTPTAFTISGFSNPLIEENALKQNAGFQVPMESENWRFYFSGRNGFLWDLFFDKL